MDDSTKIITDQPVVSYPQPHDNPLVENEAETQSNPQNVDNSHPAIEDKKQDENRNPSWFKPGQTGNPNGRPKADWTWKDLYKEVAEEMFEVKQKDGTSIKSQFKKLVAKRIFREAVNGNIGAIKELANRMDGMPKQTVEQTGEINLNINDMLSKVYGDIEPASIE